MPSIAMRHRVISLYKELHRLGRDYPDPAYNFNGRMRQLFEKNRNLTNPEDIEKALKLGEYIKNETLALYSLRKYRALKRMYDDDKALKLEEVARKAEVSGSSDDVSGSSPSLGAQGQPQGG